VLPKSKYDPSAVAKESIAFAKRGDK